MRALPALLLLAACGDPPHTITWTCEDGVGLTDPVPACAADEPCTRPLALYGEQELTDQLPLPACAPEASTLSRGRPDVDDGPPRTWVDDHGLERAWCEHRPSAGQPLPLLVFVHGSGGDADDLYGYTMLRDKADSFALSGDDGPPGFVLVATHGRTLHWPTASPQDGSKHDTYHRDPSTNPDVAYLDHIIDSLVAEGAVDPARIHMSGWSNGARFAALFGLTRHEEASPGGNRVASVATYSGGDPYADIDFDRSPSCAMTPRPPSGLPFMLVSRDCDAVGCDEDQYEAFGRGLRGWNLVPGNVASTWIDTLEHDIGATDVTWLIVDKRGDQVDGCAQRCSKARGLLNHMRWPDGVADGGGQDHEPAMLGFLRDHPLEG